MKRRFITLLTAVVCLIVLSLAGGAVSAYETTKSTTHEYICGLHSVLGWDSCAHITFYSHGETDSGDVYDKCFSDSACHWPNGFNYGDVWSYKVATTGYAKGTYTSYSSLITTWMSLAWSSYTTTITHIY